MTWSPVEGQIMTRWAEEVSPDKVWEEYPRPQMVRKEWRNLNGLWDYAITAVGQEGEPIFNSQILVPFAIESALSGVKKRLGAKDLLWYRRTFVIPPAWKKQRILFHFGAVDWKARVFVNQNFVGEHTGGYIPFWFDISDQLLEGENEIRLSVWDPTDSHWIQRGKQTMKPRSIWYTAVSGIWQTVWLEPVPEKSLARVDLLTDADEGSIRLALKWNGDNQKDTLVQVKVLDGLEVVAEKTALSMEGRISVFVPKPKLWSPESPHLYDYEISAGDDQVRGYFGLRTFSVEEGRLCLNHKPVFQYGPLDQGYWPDGLYTPPTDEAMRWDIELVKRLGCNMVRKHIKVEPARYYYHCDKIGLIVWQDMPNGGSSVNEMFLFMANLVGWKPKDRAYRRAGRADVDSRADYRRELEEMVAHLRNFACIGLWVPFNEGWGQFDAKQIAEWTKTIDPTRPVDHASGWFDQGGGDCDSVHIYFRPIKSKEVEKKRATVLSEFGGYSTKESNHLWNPEANFGFKKFANRDQLTDAYVDLIATQILPWKEKGLSAAVYTQTTDVEDEVNGYVTYDRKIEKMEFDRVRDVHRKLMDGENKIESEAFDDAEPGVK